MKLETILTQLKISNLSLIITPVIDDIPIKSKIECICNNCNTNTILNLEALFYKKNYIHCKKCQEILKKEKRYNTFLEKAIKQHGDKYTYNKNSFKNGTVEITCNRHGSFIQKTKDHVYKHGCPNCASNTLFKKGEKLLTTNSVIEKLKFNDKNITVDYSTYTGWEKRTLKGNCKLHGEFITSPKNFQKRINKCLQCAEHLNSHSKANFEKIALKNMEGKAILYVIKCTDDFETFYKIGITTKSIKERFGRKSFPYTIEIIQEIVDKATTIWTLEKELHRYFSSFQYLPLKNFAGRFECFKL